MRSLDKELGLNVYKKHSRHPRGGDDMKQSTKKRKKSKARAERSQSRGVSADRGSSPS